MRKFLVVFLCVNVLGLASANAGWLSKVKIPGPVGIGITILDLFLSTSANADDATHYATKDTFIYNEHGLVLQEDGNKVYVGKYCDIVSPTYGDGYWYWNNSGWKIAMYKGSEVTYITFDSSNLPEFSETVMDRCKNKFNF